MFAAVAWQISKNRHGSSRLFALQQANLSFGLIVTFRRPPLGRLADDRSLQPEVSLFLQNSRFSKLKYHFPRVLRSLETLNSKKQRNQSQDQLIYAT